MKLKLLLSIFVFMSVLIAHAQMEEKVKVQSNFLGVSFGNLQDQSEEILLNKKLEPIATDGKIFLKNAIINNFEFQTVAMMFSPISGQFYKIVASNKYDAKDNAEAFYNSVLAFVRETYPNAQILRHPEGADKMITYPDGNNAMYLGLFTTKSNGKKLFYVNMNFWNQHMQDDINAAK